MDKNKKIIKKTIRVKKNTRKSKSTELPSTTRKIDNTQTNNSISDIDIKKIIKANNAVVEDVNQILHNEGIEFTCRLDIIVNFLNHKYYGKKLDVNISTEIVKEILSLLDILIIDKNELFQKLFMFYCNKKTKINLDQYYTPFTIGQFISKLMIPGKKLIDPACGTGDLAINYNGNITLWDISPDVISVCKSNYELNDKKYNIDCLNSITEYEKDNDTYDYCCLNPPFGSSTVIKNTDVLDKYILGKGKKKEEIGILFIERGINLVKNNGIVFIILPNGYLGNSTKNTKLLRDYLLSYKILSVIELPGNTFSRSGTGVSTSLVILQKSKVKEPYNIFIKKIDNIGYVLNKKNTPYKYKTFNGKYILENNKPVLDNDFVDCYCQVSSFAKDNDTTNLSIAKTDTVDYEIVNTSQLQDNILDINRYLSQYKSIIELAKSRNFKTINHYLKSNVNSKFKIVGDKEYIYLDIKQITTPIYGKGNIIYGYDLPGRAKIKVMKHDIIVSKLKGKITFTMIMDDTDNIICSNGFTLLRPKDYNSGVILFGNLFTDMFKIQHKSLCTGSIMETITETDIKNIYITEDVDLDKYTKILDALSIINNEL